MANSTNLANLGSKALQVVATIAPTVATALGGPLAGLAVSKLESIFGGPGTVTDAAMLSATPDQLTAMKKVEDDFKAQLASLGVQEDQLRFADTASARTREEVVKDWTPRVLAIGTLLITFGLEGLMLLGIHLPTQIAPELQGRIFGTLDSATILVLGYYFGSSAGARSSAETLAQIAKQP
jgi:hypothetical protein